MYKKAGVMRNQQGFTLIELMITIVIIAILASIAIPSYRKYVRQNAEEQAQQHALMVADQLNRWRAKTLSYQGAIAETKNDGTCANEPNRCLSNFKKEEKDGLVKETGDIYVPRDSTDENYRYKINLSIESNRWRMLVTPNDEDSLVKSSDRYFLNNTGKRCLYPKGEDLPNIQEDIDADIDTSCTIIW